METGFGLISVLPVMVVLILAIITKNATLALLTGAVTGCFILAGGSPMGAYTNFSEIIYQVLTNADNVFIMIVIALCGGMIVLLRKSGGVLGFSKFAIKYVNGRKKSMLATWLLGIIIFIDDYLNAMAVGTVMQGITDKFKVSREMLTFLVTSTGATVCAVLPMSSWGIFMIAQMQGAGMGSGMEGIDMFVKTMPFITYCWISVIIVPLFIAKVLPIYGPMKRAEQETLNGMRTGSIYDAAGNLAENVEGADVPEEKRRAVNFILPLVILSAIIVATGDMMLATFAAIIAAFVLLLSQKIKTFMETFNLMIDGMTEMFSMVLLLIASYILLEVNTRLGMTDFVINSSIDYINPSLFAVGVFVVVAALAFGTGTFWGLAIIAFPVIIPFAQALGVNEFLVAGAIISGVTVGAHTCFYGDTVILACSTTKVNPVDYFKCAAPLCGIALAISLIFYTAGGFIF